MKWKQTWPILKASFKEFNDDKVLRLSAALAYYAMFSIGPLLAIAVGVAGLVFGHDAVRDQIQQQLQTLVGESSAKTISSMMAAQKEGTSLITTIVGVVALLVGAGGVFGQLQDSLNTVWEVKPRPGAGVWYFIRTRFLSFSMVLGTGFLLLVSMALTTFLSAITGSFQGLLPMSETLARILNFVVTFAVITLLFAMIFKLLPDTQVPWRKVWVGALGTALLFTAGKFLLGLYLGRASTMSAYGAAGSVVVVLMWVYYASVVLLVGAEFTQVYARRTGTPIEPKKYAVSVSQKDREQEGIPEGSRSGPGRPRAWGSTAAPAPGQAAVRTPGAVVRGRPWEFVGLMLAAGFVGATLLRFKHLRKAVKLYATIQRFT